MAYVRDKCGRICEAYEFAGENSKIVSKVAFNQAFAVKGISAWRTRSFDGSTWHVILMAEEEHRRKFELAARRCCSKGGAKIEPTSDLVRALRARRWEGAAEALLRGLRSGKIPAEWGAKVSYRGGALLDAEGRLQPYRRPQG